MPTTHVSAGRFRRRGMRWGWIAGLLLIVIGLDRSLTQVAPSTSSPWLWVGSQRLLANDQASGGSGGGSGASGFSTPTTRPPSFVVVLLDDADVDLLTDQSLATHFPNLNRLRQQGLRFDNYHVTTPLCGPSRMSLLTGLYPQRSSIRTNDGSVERARGAAGGTEAALAAGLASDNLGSRLQAAGMRTMFVGKYMNNGFVPTVAPGWNDFASITGANYYGFRVFQNLTKSSGEFTVPRAGTYRTRHEGDLAVQILDRHFSRSSSQPFLLFYAPLAPHRPAAGETEMVEPKHANYPVAGGVPGTPDYNEADVTDKPRAIRQLPLLSTSYRQELNRLNADRIRTVRSVDEQVGRIMARIRSSSEADNTYVILTSDNGYSLGHQRFEGKALPYERCYKVPLFVWGPGIDGGETSNQLLASIDLLPTLVEGAQGEAPVDLDGVSFLKSWFDPAAGETLPTRTAVVIENIESREERGIEVASTYVAVRLQNEIYTEWANGDLEYYDLSVDPLQLQNQASELSAAEQDWFRTLVRIERANELTFQKIESHESGDSIGPRATWRGWGEANQGIGEVRVEIRNSRTGRWWSGLNWINQPTSIPVVGTSSGELISDWRAQVNLAPTGRWDEKLLVRSVLVDQQGNRNNTPWIKITAELSAPRIVRMMPQNTNWQVKRGTRALTVRVIDHSPVRRVTAVVFDENRSRYWNGSSWQADRTQVALRRSSSGDWSVAPRFVPGTYRIEVQAEDSKGNQTPSPTVYKVLAT